MAKKKHKREPPPDLSNVSPETRQVYFVYRQDKGWGWWSDVCRIASEIRDGIPPEEQEKNGKAKR